MGDESGLRVAFCPNRLPFSSPFREAEIVAKRRKAASRGIPLAAALQTLPPGRGQFGAVASEARHRFSRARKAPEPKKEAEIRCVCPGFALDDGCAVAYAYDMFGRFHSVTTSGIYEDGCDCQSLAFLDICFFGH